MHRKVIIGRIKEQILYLLPTAERRVMPINDVALTRSDNELPTIQCFYVPMLAVVIQGEKRSVIGGHPANYGPGESVAVGVDLPGAYHIQGADAENPFLSFSLKLNKKEILDLLSEDASLRKPLPKDVSPVIVAESSLEILSCISRILDLFEHPERLKIVWPLLRKEFHYYLLTGTQGESLRVFNSGELRSAQIASAIHFLRENFNTPLAMEEVADRVHMTTSSFNRHFHKITGLSPLQFQKQLRLFEAERILVSEGGDVSSASLAVGYESLSQFIRDYKKQFGESPARDARRKKQI